MKFLAHYATKPTVDFQNSIRITHMKRNSKRFSPKQFVLQSTVFHRSDFPLNNKLLSINTVRTSRPPRKLWNFLKYDSGFAKQFPLVSCPIKFYRNFLFLFVIPHIITCPLCYWTLTSIFVIGAQHTKWENLSNNIKIKMNLSFIYIIIRKALISHFFGINHL